MEFVEGTGLARRGPERVERGQHGLHTIYSRRVTRRTRIAALTTLENRRPTLFTVLYKLARVGTTYDA